MGISIKTENRCDFNPLKADFWNRTYSFIKKVNFKVYVEFNWQTFKERKFPVIGAVHIENLKLLRDMINGGYEFTDIETDRYLGFYFESSPEFCGLFISPKKEMESLRQDFSELVSFGERHGIKGLVRLDGLSGSLLLKNVEYLLLDMMGLFRQDLIDIQKRNGPYNPLETAFWCDVYSIIKPLGPKVHIQWRWREIEKVGIPVIGSARAGDLEKVKTGFLNLGYQTFDIETPRYRGLYFEPSKGLAGLCISPKREIITRDQGILNSDLEFSILYELRAFGREHLLENLALLDFASATLLRRNTEQVIADSLGISSRKIEVLTFENSHKEYIRHYLELKNGGKECWNKERHAENSRFNKIEIFSRMYQQEIMIMAEVFGDRSVSIHDVGTNAAQFPFLISALEREDLYGLEISQILASDYAWTGEEFIREISEANPGYRPIEFLSVDLTKDLHKMPAADVIIANDVLEHLPDEGVSLSVLKGLWNKAGKLLIAHVPFEDIPNPLWGHFVCFNEDKLKDWAGRLAGSVFLSDKYFDGEKCLTSDGFLIAMKA